MAAILKFPDNIYSRAPLTKGCEQF